MRVSNYECLHCSYGLPELASHIDRRINTGLNEGIYNEFNRLC